MTDLGLKRSLPRDDLSSSSSIYFSLDENVNETKDLTYDDYDPVHFLRCHSKKDDSADISTQVWQCAFEPDPKDKRKTTSLVATCGGNSVCFTDVKTGKVRMKYYTLDLSEKLYTIAWTSNGKDTFLVAGGTSYTLHFIHPASGVLLHLGKVKHGKKKTNFLSSVIFHPTLWNLIICGGQEGEIHVCNMGNPRTPDLDVSFKVMQSFSAQSEIFSMTFCATNNMLLVGCANGLSGFSFPSDIDNPANPIKVSDIKKFYLPVRNMNTENMGPVGNTEEADNWKNKTSDCISEQDMQDLVDSVEVVSDGVIATKCALHGCIYLWNLTSTLASETPSYVRPTHLLRWSNTDNYFMAVGVQPEAKLLCCGDDKGTLWLYNLPTREHTDPNTHKREDSITQLLWPNLTDPYIEKKRKLAVNTHDIVIAKVAISSDKNHIVAVTNNNMVCIWERCKS